MFQITPRERIVTKIKHPTPPPRLVRAVIYARVSSIHEAQKTSLEAQIRYFTKVAKEKGWFLTDIYAEKRSAKRYDSQPEFKRMIEDSYLDRFDIILTKSISRFGRDTIETLETLRKLRANGIDVFFDLEQLHSIDDRNTHIITTLEAIAQEENRVRSQNIRWGIEKSLQNANSRLYQRICFGYQHDAEGLLVIKEQEAQIVRKIYWLYLDGYSILAIMRELEKEKILSPTGKAKWSKRTIDTLLSNEKYTGTVIHGKSFIEAYPSGKKKKNDGEQSKMQIENNHPSIIDQAQFDRVQIEKKRRSNVQIDMNVTKRNGTHYSMKRSTNHVVHNAEIDHSPNDIEG